MIEQTIFFALGCIVTALAALAFAPLFWRRALRLTRARLQLQVPLSMQEILAERDQLRAAFAVERLQLEQTMEKVRAGKTRDMAAIGRHSVAATAMAEEALEARAVAESQALEIRQLMADLAAAQAEAAAIRLELQETHGLAERWRDQAGRVAEGRAALRNELDSKVTLATALEARIAGLETHLADAQHAGEAREQSLRSRLETAMAQSARHETSAIALSQELDEARQRVRRLEPAAGGESGAESDAQTVDRLRAQNEALLERLTQLQHLGAAVTPGAPVQDDGSLRASIHALGLAVAGMGRSHDTASGRSEWSTAVPLPAPSEA